jgi:hypothetical protein
LETYRHRERADEKFPESSYPFEANLITSMESFLNADVLIAADILYDVVVIDSLVALVKLFLLQSPSTNEAIFAITKRNLVSFERFLNQVRMHSISCDWLASGDDCEALPHVFACNFAQSRAAVQIARLTMLSIVQ